MDTNVWISALLNKMVAPARILSVYLAEEIEIIASEPLLDELREVLLRPKFSRKYGITKRDVDSYVELIGERATVGCSDPDDEMFVETAILGKAHAVVSGDPDLTKDETIIKLLHEHGVAVLDTHRLSGRQTLFSLTLTKGGQC